LISQSLPPPDDASPLVGVPLSNASTAPTAPTEEESPNNVVVKKEQIVNEDVVVVCNKKYKEIMVVVLDDDDDEDEPNLGHVAIPKIKIEPGAPSGGAPSVHRSDPDSGAASQKTPGAGAP